MMNKYKCEVYATLFDYLHDVVLVFPFLYTNEVYDKPNKRTGKKEPPFPALPI